MQAHLLDDFLTERECNILIEHYTERKDFVKKYHTNLCLDLDPNDLKIKFLKDKLNYWANYYYQSEIDWFQIVQWPTGAFQPVHLDTTSPLTTCSSITYLNDDFLGGNTFFNEGTIFKPKKRRTLFFDGMHFRHGVTTVQKGIRFVVASWYKKL
tara:strand:+ start:1216 stop:1677 length:462 start_codon:yes stop_codon:yes gene_type:complete